MKRILKRMTGIVIAAALLITPMGTLAESGSAAGAAVAQARPTTWDLTDLYADDAAVEADIAKLTEQIAQLANFRGTLSTVDGVVAWYQSIEESIQLNIRLRCYATLLTSLNAGDNAAQTLLGRISNLSYEMNAATAFVEPELFSQSDAFLDSVEQDPRMADYLLEFQRARKASAHMLSEEQETLLLPLSKLTQGASQLYDSLSYLELPYADIEFPDGVTRPADENNYLLALHGGYDQGFRKQYSDTMLGAYTDFRNTLAQNYHNYCTGVSEYARAHGYASALEADLTASAVEPALYQAVIDASLRGSDVVKRYVELMRQELGLAEIYSFDMNLPIAKGPGKTYTYDEACELVLAALAPLGETYVADAREALSSGWVDVYAAEGKSSGAFAMGIYGVHPYMLLNFDGTFAGVGTLAHELGHVMHQWYSAKAQPTSYTANAGTTVSEVASTLNELLLTDYMIQNAQSDAERKYYIAEEMSTIYSAFFTQASFSRFQQLSMEAVESGETLTADLLDTLWLENNAYYDGEGSMSVVDNYRSGWARIPHFYMGFYTYSYAAAISASCAIAQRIVAGEEGAVESYLAYLAAGDTGSDAQMLAIAGVDATNADFIDGLLNRFESLMDAYQAAQ